MRLEKVRFKYTTCVNIALITVLLIYGTVCQIGLLQYGSINTFRTRLDTFWHNQDIMYGFRAQLEGTGSRSEI